MLVSKQLYDVIERRCDEAARHIENRGKENTAPHGKRFTIDKAVITLSDFVEENDSKVCELYRRRVELGHPISFAFY